ncbi:MAG: TonB family protein [Paludibacteraceae bacterium]|nr:TonB family protein [Paludibacteraceae bacterium]
MEVKKSASASLENKSSDFLLMGLVVALGFLFIFFEWTTTDVKKIETSDAQAIFEEEEMMEVTVQKDVPPPPPAAVAPQPVVAPEIKVVENTVETKDIEIKSSEETGEAVEAAPIDNGPEEVEEEEIFMRVEKAPSFPGGQKAMMEYLMKNIKYPAACQEAGIQGRVIVSFVVNKDGTIQNVEVIRGVHEKLDAEAVRVVKSMPAWSPGEQQGRKVRSKFQLPVFFRLAS